MKAVEISVWGKIEIEIRDGISDLVCRPWPRLWLVLCHSSMVRLKVPVCFNGGEHQDRADGLFSSAPEKEC